MSAETFTTALFLITAVIAAGVLINAVFPVVYTMAGTFQSSTHEADTRLRTDFKIVATVPNATYGYVIYMKNIGSQRISLTDIQRSDVICGPVGNFARLTYRPNWPSPTFWTEDLMDLPPENTYWDPGETLAVYANPNPLGDPGDPIYFQFILPNGIWRSNEFTVS